MINDHRCPGFTDENPRYGKLSSLPAITQKVAGLAFQHSWLQSPQPEAIGQKGKGWVVLRAQFPALCTKKPPTIEGCRLFAEEPDLVGLISCLLFWNTCSSPPFHFIIQFNSKKKITYGAVYHVLGTVPGGGETRKYKAESMSFCVSVTAGKKDTVSNKV